jgi:hypothetical protein
MTELGQRRVDYETDHEGSGSNFTLDSTGSYLHCEFMVTMQLGHVRVYVQGVGKRWSIGLRQTSLNRVLYPTFSRGWYSGN